MGYYTRFKVDFKVVGERDPHLPFIQDDSPGLFVPVLNPLVDRGYEIFGPDGWSNDSLKWYDWERDMMAASSHMPGVLMTLTGSGEDAGDIWRAYFLDGKVQSVRPTMEFPEFDQAQLRDKPHMESRNTVDIWG